MYKQGAMVIPGSVGLDLEYYAVKLTSKSAASLTTYNNTTVTGGSSGVVADVVGVATQTVLILILYLLNTIKQVLIKLQLFLQTVKQ